MANYGVSLLGPLGDFRRGGGKLSQNSPPSDAYNIVQISKGNFPNFHLILIKMELLQKLFSIYSVRTSPLKLWPQKVNCAQEFYIQILSFFDNF